MAGAANEAPARPVRAGTNVRRVIREIIAFMGFALWMEPDVAWAQGTHEYRPMGAAVVARSDLFRGRDFSPWRKPPSRRDSSYVGLFGSLEDLNLFMRKGGRRDRLTRSLLE